MKTLTLFLLLASVHCCFGQTDTNVIAVGEWSDPVNDSDGHTLRGRLLVYDAQAQSAANHARIYLELQHVFREGWSNPLEVYFNIDSSADLHFELRDQHGQPIPQTPITIRGTIPPPCWVTMPCDSTVRLRADTYTLGPGSKPDGLELLVNNACWIIPRNATNAFFLSGTLTPPKDHPSSLNYHVWQGILKFPKLRIPTQMP